MSEIILVDTGPLVAILCPDDENHAGCAAELRRHREPFLTCWPVLTEAAWLVRREANGIKRLFGFVKCGIVKLTALDDAAPDWISNFVQKYASAEAQVADAALMYLAEQFRAETVFTTNRRDFSLYRTTDGRALRIIPETPATRQRRR